jgi:molybdate transport system regulatory protein
MGTAIQMPMEGAFNGRFWLEKAGRAYLGKGKVHLLSLIDECGSITHAAQVMGMSYKAAWDSIRIMNSLSDQPLVVKTRGGIGGGETRLTPYGKEVVKIFQVFQDEHDRFLNAMSRRLGRFNSIDGLVQRFTMRSSARNQFWGRVTSVKRGAVNSEVALSIGEGDSIVASITNESSDSLGLQPGREACALIKASFVIVVTGDQPIRTSARNCLRGTVTRCEMGAVNGEVTIGIKGGKSVIAILTLESIRSLELAVGVPCAALVKASHVIIAVND